MFRIRRVIDDVRPRDREAVSRVQAILRSRFSAISEEEVATLPQRLRDPMKYRFRYILMIADDIRGRINGFALTAHAPDLRFAYLDFISTTRRMTGGGIGGALYQRVREEARALNTIGIFMECLPDDPALCRDPELLRQNRMRLRFYERFGAYPVINTAYETPFSPDEDCPPYLVFDDLGRGLPLKRQTARQIVRAILERKYGERCPPGYIEMVTASFRDDPVRLRPPRYVKTEGGEPPSPRKFPESRIALVVHDRHAIHHVHEQGYVESPVRIRSILKELEKMSVFRRLEPHRFRIRHVKDVHDHKLVDYLRRVGEQIGPDESVYPYVFPVRNASRPPTSLPIRAGYFCIDTFTPLNRQAYYAALRAVDCALTAAESLFHGYRAAYALVRPPGHHAERSVFGGFCYFNSTAIAANHLSEYGRVAVLDIDHHHGNGTQDIFYSRNDVLTISIHGHPRFTYPYFSGFREERGEGPGTGYNVNYPLGEQVDGAKYKKILERALGRIKRFHPEYLVLAVGFDTAKDDPTGSWSLKAEDFENNGRLLGALRLPTLIVQEGGYRIRSLGTNARRFFKGFWTGAGSPPP